MTSNQNQNQNQLPANEFLQGGFTAIPKASSQQGSKGDTDTDTFAAELLLAGLAVFVLYIIYVFHKGDKSNGQ